MAKTEPKDRRNYSVGNSGGDAVYAFGIFGALIYYFQQADTLWLYVLAVIKAFIWPAMLVFELLKFIGA